MRLFDIAQMIDHSLLHPTMSDEDIRQGCVMANQYKVATVCVKPYSVKMAREILKKSTVGICAVVGFPHGNSTTEMKLRETQEVIANGVSEVDMVINMGKVKSGAWDYVKDEIQTLNRVCQRHSALLKVIFENDFLSDEEIVRLCKICTELEPAFIKTSTGFGFVKQDDGRYAYQGAAEHQVKLMRKHVPQSVQIKAAGGVRTLDDLLKFKNLGCTRIGASATEAIMQEAKARGFEA